MPKTPRHPRWLKVPLPAGKNFQQIHHLIKRHQLHTVCQTAHCPNIGECWNNRTATFMLLGDICTRNCHFCAVKTGVPNRVDEEEPFRVASAAAVLELQYVVITSVTRDDLPDGGASIFAETVRQIRQQMPQSKVELLVPDFQGNSSSIGKIIEAQPDVLNHNLETVPRLYPQVRPHATYERSLLLLKQVKQAGLITKSGLMLGIGETNEEILNVMADLRSIECDFLTLGQYLQPSSDHSPIARYITPAEFSKLRQRGLEIGFKHIEAGPLIRSSYHAAAHTV